MNIGIDGNINRSGRLLAAHCASANRKGADKVIMDGCLDAVAPAGANCETSATLASCSWDALERRHPWPPRDWSVAACSSIKKWVLGPSGEDSPSDGMGCGPGWVPCSGACSLLSPSVIHGWCARVDAPKLGWWSTPPKQQISPPARPPTACQPLPLACQRPRACFSPPAGRPNRLRLRSAFRQSITQSGQSVNQSGSETQHRASPSHVASATCFPFPFAFPS